MLKKKILASLSSVLLVAALVGGATFAEFSSTADSTKNTFTAGTLDLKVANNLFDTFSKNAVGTWVSPAGWAPGDTATGTLQFTNDGTINSKHVYFNFTNLTASTTNLAKAILVTDINERFNGVNTGNQVTNIAAQVGDGVMPLTLAELESSAYYTWDDKSGDGIILSANGQKDYALNFTFQFDPNAGNEYQGTSTGFTLAANATQNSPTEGFIKLHE